MSNPFFQFKQFTIHQDHCAMKVTTDACLFGAWAANEIRTKKVSNILDIGTGTGLLALMTAQKVKADIDAIEIDKAAAMQAMQNVKASLWKDHIAVVNADAKTFSFSKKYDAIISNPPFYENELKSDNAKKNIAHHNESLLLPELLSIIKTKLKSDGRFFLLLPYKRNRKIKDLLLQHEFNVCQMILVRQSVNHDYFRIMMAGKLKTNEPGETMIDEISIWNDKQQYTQEFVALLKDYYLYL